MGERVLCGIRGLASWLSSFHEVDDRKFTKTACNNTTIPIVP